MFSLSKTKVRGEMHGTGMANTVLATMTVIIWRPGLSFLRATIPRIGA